MKGRSILVIVLILILIALVIYIIARRPGGITGLFRQDEPGLPVDLAAVIPSEWTVAEGAPPQCDYDNDSELEWLVQYQYNVTTVPAASGTEGAIAIGPRGAAIFDLQTDLPAQSPEDPGPYRPSSIVPYNLLPDLYSGKGQGYLGETAISIFNVPLTQRGASCRADEINILGYGNAGLPTRVSVFRWGSKDIGYRAAHLAGSAGVVSEPRADSGSPITRVTTYDRLENHRSILCDVRTYDRTGTPEALDFRANDPARTVDFCYGPPADLYHPEGAVVALLRNYKPNTTSPNVPPLPTYLFSNAIVPPEMDLTSATRKPIPIVRILNPGSVEPGIGQGRWCETSDIEGAGEEQWWCDRERALVAMEIKLDGVSRRVDVLVTSVVPANVTSDVHWRVREVRLLAP